jgi:arabinose-5-phosphate isomerase
MDLLSEARRVLRDEARAIERLADALDERFVQAVELLLRCPGRVVLTGMGKSGLVAKKIAATFSSTGTPAMFLHPADALHGDLGSVQRGDLMLALSHSGATGELLTLVPVLRFLAVPLVLVTGDPKSELAQEATLVLTVPVEEEACPLGLAPTSSTTAAMALGDALAACLLRRRRFSEADFRRLHPGGRLGQRLRRVREFLHCGAKVPRVGLDTPFRQVLQEIIDKKLGLTTVVDGAGRLVGIITDGDIKRALVRNSGLEFTAEQAMTRSPRLIGADEPLHRAVEIMDSHVITALVAVDEEGRPSGVLKLQDLLFAGYR